MKTVHVSNIVIKPEHTVRVPKGKIVVLEGYADSPWSDYHVYTAGESFRAEDGRRYHVLDDGDEVRATRGEFEKGGGHHSRCQVTDTITNRGGQPEVKTYTIGNWSDYDPLD